MILSVCMCGPAANTHASSSSMHVPPLANDRCNETFVKDGTIHHVVWSAGTRLKAEKSPRLRAGSDRGGITKFISYYTLKCDLVTTSVKFNQVLDSVLLKVNQCPS